MLVLALFALFARTQVMADETVQEPPESTFAGEAAVVAVDVLVGAEPGGILARTRPRLPAALDPEGLEIRVAGARRPLVAFEALDDGRPVAAEPWHLVVAVDLATSPRGLVRRGAALLEARADDLAALGVVEIVVLTPEPRRLLAPSDDAAVIEQVLSRLAVAAESDDSLSARRAGFLAAAASGRATAFGARAAADAEAAEIRRLQDELLVYLAETSRASPATSRRALLWLSAGHALDPALELAALLQGGSADARSDASATGLVLASELAAPPAIDTAADTEGFARALAALGWLVDPLSPPPPDPMRGRAGGLRIGKLRISKRGVVYEAERRPERAAAALELATVRRASGDLEGAEEAYRQALHNFFGDRRTADRQIEAWRGLAEVLEAQRRLDAARAARAAAAELSARFGEGSTLEPTERPDLEAEPSLQMLARATGGLPITTDGELEHALVDLELRFRVTYQVDARLEVPRPLTVRVPGRADGLDLWAPRWTRAAGSPRLDAARRRVDSAAAASFY